jgi:hypothetical protein
MEEYRKVLVLPLKEKWYRMIESGKKDNEGYYNAVLEKFKAQRGK